MVMGKLEDLRNIGISAHIDSGKTTLTERILYYTGKIHRMGEIRAGGATMDHMELEREKGITITSAATTVSWGQHTINIIDTPGHVDFTIEVERCLRVLDGAILVLCAVGGVQSQSITVDRQMKRYHIPRLAFVNKLDRPGANPQSIPGQLKDKLGVIGVPLQIPMDKAENFEGVIDLVRNVALFFDGSNGEVVREMGIPPKYLPAALEARGEMLDRLSMYSDPLLELLLEGTGDLPEALVDDVIRQATLSQEITPILFGSAYRNKGVQPLLDAVTRYLPSPLDREVVAQELGPEGHEVEISCDKQAPMVGMAFKLVDEPFGQVTYFRVYQGTVLKGNSYVNSRTGRRQRFMRILRIHADQTEEVPSASAGEIIAVVGIDGASGDTYCDQNHRFALENIFVPQPVISLAVAPLRRGDSEKFAKALARFRKEDPTFQVSTDPETKEMVIHGMGELHLQIYLERIRREYNVILKAGAPKVSYREAPSKPAKFDYRHRKQTGGAGQYAHIIGKFLLCDQEQEGFVFEDKVTGGRIPREYISSVRKGFESAMQKGPLAGFEVVGLGIELEDGSHHQVDSSDLAFQICAQNCFREKFSQTKPVLLEPVMKIEIEVPSEFQGSVGGELSSRRGTISGSETREGLTVLQAEVPLACMFGYATDLRSATQGKGTFSMEFSRYARVPANIQEEIVKTQGK